MKKIPIVYSLLFFNMGIFMATITFLPRRRSFGHNGPISYFFNSRDRWDIAWGLLIASICLSLGIFFLLQAKGLFEKKQKNSEQADSSND